MLTRLSRATDELRPCSIIANVISKAAGSALIELGDTKVLCVASFEAKVPHWMRKQSLVRQGWLTAEYAMLPYATDERKTRDCVVGKRDSRSVEIQRLIGRSLRAVMDLTVLSECTLWIDCDVLQADGGTRTASISGAYVAAQLAVQRMLAMGKLKKNPFKGSVAAVSVGICDGVELLDLSYEEDCVADVDCNVVMGGQGELIEIQGTAERRPFSKGQLDTLLQLAQVGISKIRTVQQQALEQYNTQ